MSTTKPETSIVSNEGLRYKVKVSGTPFPESDRGVGSTMSCFKCGKHRTRSLLTSKRFFGKYHQVCKEGCGP